MGSILTATIIILANFYAQIIPANSDDDMYSCNNNSLSIKQLQKRLNKLTETIKQKEKKRMLSNCPFTTAGIQYIWINI